MTVTSDVIRDLLPLYAAGEASQATRKLVEHWVRADSSLQRELLALGSEVPASGAPQHQPAQPEPDRALLSRTRRLIRLRMSLMAGAIVCTFMPLTIAGKSGQGVTFIMMRDAPQVGWTFVVGAALFWSAYALVARRLRVTGL